MIDHYPFFEDPELVTCPCCMGGVDILMDCGMTCELCYTRGQVETYEAAHYEAWYQAHTTALDRVEHRVATALDVIMACSRYG